MKKIDFTERDYEKLLLLIKSHQEIFGMEGITTWSFDDINDLQEIGTEIVNILKSYAEIR